MILYKTKYYVSKEAIIGTGLALGGLAGSVVTGIDYMKTARNISEDKDNKEISRLKNKLVESFKKKNGENNIIEAPDYCNAAAISMDFFENFIKKMETNKDFREKVEKEAETNPEFKASLYLISHADLTRPCIVYDPRLFDPATMSHEIGHTEYYEIEENKDKNKFIKFTHKYPPHISDMDDLNGLITAPILGGITGVVQGISNGPGRLKNGLIMYSSIDAILLMIRELAASKRGLELLKEAGATEDDLKVFRKMLLSAAGSYFFNNLSIIGLELVSAKTGSWVVNKLKKLFKRK